MLKDVETLIKSVESATGIRCAVFSATGDKVVFSGEDKAFSFCTDTKWIGSEFVHEETGFVYFGIATSAKMLVGVIKNTGAECVNYAKLLSDVIASRFRTRSRVDKKELIASVLNGELTRLELRNMKNGLDFPDGNYYISAISVNTKRENEVEEVVATLANSPYDFCSLVEHGVIAFVKYLPFSDKNVTAIDIAETVYEAVYNETGLGIKVCMGSEAHCIEDFAESYTHAYKGLKTAGYLSYNKALFSYREFLLVEVLESLPTSVVNDYKKKLLSKEIEEVLKESDLTNTAEVFMNYSLNLSETARALYIHRNTLMYRLDKIERGTGLNIKNFADAVTFRILEVLYKMNKAAE